MLGTAAVVATGSRTSLVGLVVVAYLITIARPTERSVRSMTWVTVLAAGFIAIAASAGAGPLARFAPSQFSSGTHSAEGNRLDLWGVALRGIWENPWGVGVGNYSAMHRFINAPHNIVLEYTVEVGWLAGLVVLAGLGAAHREAWRRVTGRDGVEIASVFWFQAVGLMVGGEATLTAVPLYLAVLLLTVRSTSSYGARSR